MLTKENIDNLHIGSRLIARNESRSDAYKSLYSGIIYTVADIYESEATDTVPAKKHYVLVGYTFDGAGTLIDISDFDKDWRKFELWFPSDDKDSAYETTIKNASKRFAGYVDTLVAKKPNSADAFMVGARYGKALAFRMAFEAAKKTIDSFYESNFDPGKNYMNVFEHSLYKEMESSDNITHT